MTALYFWVVTAFAVSLFQASHQIQDDRILPSCPKYSYCKLSTPSYFVGRQTGCATVDESTPCPGGRQSCYPPENFDEAQPQYNICCCIKYDRIYKHLAAGSRKPEKDPENFSFRVYFMQYCPFCHRVGLILGAKRIYPDIVYVDLQRKPDWFTNISDTVPAIETDEGVIRDSLILSDFLDETYARRGEFYPSDTYLKAVDRTFIDKFSKLIPGLFSDIVTGKGFRNESDVAVLITQFEETLLDIEASLDYRGTKFFGGEFKPGMVDFMIWPWFERRPVIEIFYPDAIDYRKYSKTLATWIKLMQRQDAVQAYGLAPQLHYEYLQGVRLGKTNYNLLAEPK